MATAHCLTEDATEDRFISVNEARRILDVDPTTVRLLIERGVLTSRTLPTLPPRVSRNDCLRLAAASVKPATVGPAARLDACE